MLSMVLLPFALCATDGARESIDGALTCKERKQDAHVGLNLRTDFGTHPLRVDGGFRSDPWDFVLVVDPMVFLDGQHDLDVMASWSFTTGWSAFLGWRGTSVGIAGGTLWEQKSVQGVAGRFPEIIPGYLRAQWGLEIAVLWVKHGAGLEAEPISFASSRDWLDHINFGMFLRLETYFLL